MSGFGYSDWSYDPFEKMVIFPPDPLVEGGEGERREEWGEVSGFYINRLINSKSPKTLRFWDTITLPVKVPPVFALL